MAKGDKVPEPQPQGVLLDCWSDAHAGSTLGLMPPRTYQFADANVKPNRLQRMIWPRFEQFTDIVRTRRTGLRLVVALNGDLVDGDHHNTHQLVTRKVAEQRRIFADALDYHLQTVGYSESSGDLLYILNGTDLGNVHGSGADADDIAREFGAVPFLPPSGDADGSQEDDEGKRRRSRDGWYPWQQLELDIYGHLVQLRHHPPAGVGRRSHVKGNALRGWLRSYLQERDARRLRLPRYSIFAHLHSAHREQVRFDNGKPNGHLAEVFVLPALQGQNEFVHQKLPMVHPTGIGGMWASFDPEGRTEAALEYVELDLDRKPEVIR